MAVDNPKTNRVGGTYVNDACLLRIVCTTDPEDQRVDGGKTSRSITAQKKINIKSVEIFVITFSI